MKNKHYHWLDLIRFLAAFTVLVVHARALSFVEYGALLERNIIIALGYAATRLGNEAVIVFFVLSGFFVGGKSIEKIIQGTFNPVSYSVDRSVRLFLPLIPALFLTIIVALIIGGNIDWFTFIGNIFSLQGVVFDVFPTNNPLWSLSYEVWFYFLTLILGIYSFNRSNNIYPFIFIIIVALVFTKLTPVYLFCWAIGALAYFRRPNDFSSKTIFLTLILIVYSIAGTQFGAESLSIESNNIRKYLPDLDASRIILSFSIALFIQQIILIVPQSKLAIKIDRMGSNYASSSYTLYLTHYPVLLLLDHLGLGKSDIINSLSVFVFLLKIIVCIFVSYVFYILFEKHTKYVKMKLKTIMNKN